MSSFAVIRKTASENSSSLKAFTCLSCTAVVFYVIAAIGLYIFALNTVFTYGNLSVNDVPKYRDNICLNATCTGNERAPNQYTSLEYWVLLVDVLYILVPVLLGTFVLIGILYGVDIMIAFWIFMFLLVVVNLLVIVYSIVIMFDCSKFALCMNDDGNLDTVFIIHFVAEILVLIVIILSMSAAYVFEKSAMKEFTRKNKGA